MDKGRNFKNKKKSKRKEKKDKKKYKPRHKPAVKKKKIDLSKKETNRQRKKREGLEKMFLKNPHMKKHHKRK